MKELLNLCSENHIGWIPWKPQEPRTRCTAQKENKFSFLRIEHRIYEACYHEVLTSFSTVPNYEHTLNITPLPIPLLSLISSWIQKEGRRESSWISFVGLILVMFHLSTIGKRVHSASGMYAKKELLYDSDTVCSLCSEHSDSSKSFWLYRLWLGLCKAYHY